uniref:CSON014601 protein n=1 Tax=Culicoides sonorensis TaxID=179676 RepID=A0A336MC59_CULSO
MITTIGLKELVYPSLSHETYIQMADEYYENIEMHSNFTIIMCVLARADIIDDAQQINNNNYKTSIDCCFIVS